MKTIQLSCTRFYVCLFLAEKFNINNLSAYLEKSENRPIFGFPKKLIVAPKMLQKYLK